jgi:hypothetical protein
MEEGERRLLRECHEHTARCTGNKTYTVCCGGCGAGCPNENMLPGEAKRAAFDSFGPVCLWMELARLCLAEHCGWQPAARGVAALGAGGDDNAGLREYSQGSGPRSGGGDFLSSCSHVLEKLCPSLTRSRFAAERNHLVKFIYAITTLKS